MAGDKGGEGSDVSSCCCTLAIDGLRDEVFLGSLVMYPPTEGIQGQ